MALTSEQRLEARNLLMRELAAGGPVTVTKAEILAGIAAWDDYLDANAVQINAALPQPLRGALTLPQKVALFKFVLDLRYGG